MLPNLIIAGAQKSASTFIQTILSDHPEVYLPKQEVPFFEDPDYGNMNIKEFDKIFMNRKEKVLGIKRPNYLCKPEVGPRLAEIIPNAKVLIILRNPIDRAISAYFHNIKYGFLPPLPIEEGLDKVIDGSINSEYPRAAEIVNDGFYYKCLQLYEHFFQTGNILILLHEDILQNKKMSIQRIYDFLGINSSFNSKNINLTPQKVIYNIKRLKFIRVRNNLVYKYNNKRTRIIGHKHIFSRIINFSFLFLDEKVLGKFLVNEKPQISNKLKRKLTNIYKTDIYNLEKLLRRDLSHWLK